MRLKIDENLPLRLGRALQALGHDVDTAASEGLLGSDDQTVWAAAQGDSRFLITQDLDFSDVRLFPPGSHSGLMIVRMTAAGREALTMRIEAVFRDRDAETWVGCVVVLKDRKIRVRRP